MMVSSFLNIYEPELFLWEICHFSMYLFVHLSVYIGMVSHLGLIQFSSYGIFNIFFSILLLCDTTKLSRIILYISSIALESTRSP